ncbi:MAG: hypothetical protein DMF56_18005 [Acidobacteria bacterium]|nr:MAG: hypothetical protein DMF56_18005 [Acidobacteriota bacterium]
MLPAPVRVSDPPSQWKCERPAEAPAWLVAEGVTTPPVLACRDDSGAMLLLSFTDLSTSRTGYSVDALVSGAEEQLPGSWHVQKKSSGFGTRQTPSRLSVAHVRLVGNGNGMTFAAGGSTPTLVLLEQVPLAYSEPSTRSRHQYILAFELRTPLPPEAQRKAAIAERETQLARWVDTLAVDSNSVALLQPSEFAFLASTDAAPTNTATNAPATVSAATVAPPPSPAEATAKAFLGADSGELADTTVRELEQLARTDSTLGSAAAETLRRTRLRAAAARTPQVWRAIAQNTPKDALPSRIAVFLRAALLNNDATTARAVIASATESSLTLASFSEADLQSIGEGLQASPDLLTDGGGSVLAIDAARDGERLARLLARSGATFVDIARLARPMPPDETRWKLLRSTPATSLPVYVRSGGKLGRLVRDGAIARFEPFTSLVDVARAVRAAGARNGSTAQ